MSKKYILLILLILLYSSQAQDVVKQSKRFSDDKNIIGYLAINRPDKVYEKADEINKSLSRNFLKIYNEEYNDFLPIIQESSSIVVIYYYFQKDISIGYFITVKNKNVFDCEYVNDLENKVIVNNTLIFSEEDDEESIKVFKNLFQKALTITTKSDMEYYYDIKHLFEIDENKNNFSPIELNVIKQFDYISACFNFNKTELSQDITLTPKANSNLQKMLSQPKIDDTSLLDALGHSNLFLSISQFDFSKAIPFLTDIQAVFDEKTKKSELKKEEKVKTLNLFESVGIVRFATKWNFDSKLTNAHILKFDNAKKLITDLLKNDKTDDSYILNPTLSNFLSLYDSEYVFHDVFEYYFGDMAEKALREYNIKISTFEKMTEFDVFKISFETKQIVKENDDSNSIFFSANNNFVVMGNNLDNTRDISSKLKTPSTKNNILLDSINHFKSGFISYTDINVPMLFKSILTKEINVDGAEIFNKFFKGSYKPLKLAAKMDGNLSLHLHVEIATIRPIISLFLEDEFDALEALDEENDDGNNRSQP